jgi:hypothetical protein
MDSSVLPKDEIWFLRVCHHISNAVYLPGVGGGEQKGKRTLGSCSHRWKVNFKFDLQEIGWTGVNLIGLPKDRAKWRAFVKALMNCPVL